MFDGARGAPWRVPALLGVRLGALAVSAAATFTHSADIARPAWAAGDHWSYRRTDLAVTQVEPTEFSFKVLASGSHGYEVEIRTEKRTGLIKLDADLNQVPPRMSSLPGIPLPIGTTFMPLAMRWPMSPGSSFTGSGPPPYGQWICTPGSTERITVKAGQFDAFPIQCTSRIAMEGSHGPPHLVRNEATIWYAGAAKAAVRIEERMIMERDSRTLRHLVLELLSLQVKQR